MSDAALTNPMRRVICPVRRAVPTYYRPAFGLIIDVPIDKGLGFNPCFASYFDYVLSIHFFALSQPTYFFLESTVFIYIDVFTGPFI
jgi:hypothetical protein